MALSLIERYGQARRVRACDPAVPGPTRRKTLRRRQPSRELEGRGRSAILGRPLGNISQPMLGTTL